MKMEQGNLKYEKVLEILKRTKPMLESTDEIEEMVLRRISEGRKMVTDHPDLFDFLFGWTYIKWVRRSLVAASVCLVLMFVFQQSVILRQISSLSRQIEVYERDASGLTGNDLNRKMLLMRYSEKRFPFSKMTRSEKQVEELFKTIDQLKKEYKELQNMIDGDPELKRLIEQKLSEIDGKNKKL